MGFQPSECEGAVGADDDNDEFGEVAGARAYMAF